MSAVACWIAAVPVATARGSSWASASAIGLLVGGVLCLVLALWAFGFWSAILGPCFKVGKRLASAVANWSPVVTIDRQLAKSDTQLGLEYLLGFGPPLPPRHPPS